MTDDDEYEEFDAVVRKRKGEDLADSHKTEGWSRGFTKKTSERGPDHVEIRIKDVGEIDDEPQPRVIYFDRDGDSSRRLSPFEQFLVDVATGVLEILAEEAKRGIALWWEVKARPAVAGKWEEFKARRIERKAIRAANKNPVPQSREGAAEHQVEAYEVAVEDGEHLVLTPEQYVQLVHMLAKADEVQAMLRNAIAHAEVVEGEPTAIEQISHLRALPHDRRSAEISDYFAANPSILNDLGRHLVERGPLELDQARPRPIDL